MNNNTKDNNIKHMLIDIQRLDTSTYVFKSHNLIESGYDFNLNEQRAKSFEYPINYYFLKYILFEYKKIKN